MDASGFDEADLNRLGYELPGPRKQPLLAAAQGKGDKVLAGYRANLVRAEEALALSCRCATLRRGRASTPSAHPPTSWPAS